MRRWCWVSVKDLASAWHPPFLHPYNFPPSVTTGRFLLTSSPWKSNPDTVLGLRPASGSRNCGCLCVSAHRCMAHSKGTHKPLSPIRHPTVSWKGHSKMCLQWWFSAEVCTSDSTVEPQKEFEMGDITNTELEFWEIGSRQVCFLHPAENYWAM